MQRAFLRIWHSSVSVGRVFFMLAGAILCLAIGAGFLLHGVAETNLFARLLYRGLGLSFVFLCPLTVARAVHTIASERRRRLASAFHSEMVFRRPGYRLLAKRAIFLLIAIVLALEALREEFVPAIRLGFAAISATLTYCFFSNIKSLLAHRRDIKIDDVGLHDPTVSSSIIPWSDITALTWRPFVIKGWADAYASVDLVSDRSLTPSTLPMGRAQLNFPSTTVTLDLNSTAISPYLVFEAIRDKWKLISSYR